ncbi:MAG: hypothetical protein IJI24_06520 [Lachnospiraceae bacterium]|nr:hypothetical protein [Lachnospiraceae bacterium]
MGDVYREILIKKEKKSTDVLLRVALIALTVVLAAAGLLISMLFLIFALAAGVLCYFVSQNLDLEYEYLYVNGDIDVDKIMGKERRKRCGSFALSDLELAAPTGSHELDSYTGKAKIRDFTSGKAGAKSWSLVYHHEEQMEILMAELDDGVIADLKRRAPRKVSSLYR